MSDRIDRPVLQQDFDNIKPKSDGWVAQLFEIIESGIGEESAFLFVHGSSRPGPFLGGPGFHFDKHEAIVFPEYKIDFSVSGVKICSEEFEAEGNQVIAGRLFAEMPAAKMLGSGRLRRRFPPPDHD